MQKGIMMNSTVNRARRAHRRRYGHLTAAVALLAGTSMLMVSVAAGTANAATSVNLGTAGSYSVLAGSTVTNTGTTTLSGDVGLSPGPAISDLGTLIVGGATNVANATAAQAQLDLTTAYNVAAAQTPPTRNVTGVELSGQTLLAGVYKSTGALALGTTVPLTLDAQGDPDAVFVFQAVSTLTTAPSSKIVMVNGAQACHVFWQVGSSATLKADSAFVGTIMANQSIALQHGATVAGRALASIGAVTLDSNTFTSAACTAAPPTTTKATATTTKATVTTKATATAKVTATTKATVSAAGGATPSTTKTAAGAAAPTPTTPALAITGPKHVNGLVGIGGALVAVGLIFLWGARTRRPTVYRH